MKLFRFFCVFLVCAFTVLFAQQSIGFSESATTQSLLDYRLPSWGISLLAWDFEVNTNNNFIESENRKQRNAEYSMIINPFYHQSYESETVLYDFNTQFNISGDINITEISHSNDIPYYRKQNNEANLGINLDFMQNRYCAKKFIQTATTLNGFLFQRRSKSISSYPDLDIRRYFTGAVKVGLGIGRVRNVTPVIRALRFRERLQSLEKGLVISDAQLRDLARVIAQNSGYYSVYDRSDKYYWSDFFDVVPHIRPAVTNYEYHYLCDMADEVIGTRYAGWETVTGIEFHEVHQNDSGWCNDNRFLGLYIDARFYKNINLKQQVGITGSIYSAANLRGELLKKTDGTIQINLSYLNSLADRFLLRTNLNTNIRTGNFLSHYQGLYLQRMHSASISLTYFIENHLQLSSSISLSHNTYNQYTTTDISSGINLTYYFDRQLLH